MVDRRSLGQTLPLFAITMPIMLGLMGLGLDGARAFLERRDAQGAADLAALSGAKDLPDQTAATATATGIAVANGFEAALVDVTFPATNRIRVEIEPTLQLLFMPVLGMSSLDVKASAVAVHKDEVVAGEAVPLNGPAILANQSGCGKDYESVLKWTGGGTQDNDADGIVEGSIINGLVVTNAGVTMSGTGNVMTGTYVDDPPACDNTAETDKSPLSVFSPASPTDYPLDPAMDAFANPFAPGGICAADPDSTYPRVLLDSTNEIPAAYLTSETVGGVAYSRIADGVYCRVNNATTPTVLAPFINVKDKKICDFCTFVGETVQVGKDNILSAPAIAVNEAGTVCDVTDPSLANECGGYPLLIYATFAGSKALNWTGGGFFNGLLFTPFGHSFISGHDGVTIDAAVWSRLVEISGDDIVFNGPTEWEISFDGGPAQPELVALVE